MDPYYLEKHLRNNPINLEEVFTGSTQRLSKEN